jgi:hypothetical protein
MPRFTFVEPSSSLPKREHRDDLCVCYVFHQPQELGVDLTSSGQQAFALAEISDLRSWLTSEKAAGVTHVIEDLGGFTRLVEIDTLINSIR